MSPTSRFKGERLEPLKRSVQALAQPGRVQMALFPDGVANREYMIFRAPTLPTGVRGYAATVQCQLERKDRVIAFVIEDNGVGVPEDIQISIGHPLRRRWEAVDDHNELGGLGLFLAKFVAEMYGVVTT